MRRKETGVLRLKSDGSNSIKIEMGNLKQGMYAVRIIAALPELIKDYKADYPRRTETTCFKEIEVREQKCPHTGSIGPANRRYAAKMAEQSQ